MVRFFKQNRILPFKPKFRHTLEEGDEAKRLDFCLEMGNSVLNYYTVCVKATSASFEKGQTKRDDRYRIRIDGSGKIRPVHSPPAATQSEKCS
ncbi:hypothetical protein NQ318_014250 [Aromia moschata]|uniref:Uncharacterized protein n=1 Tax=Aromia moschata TaxID=1265417 RepID=A0AAV8YYV0_9CUCU|nr:hypothetical protein NQ318_014250 [Aromia moschata]